MVIDDNNFEKIADILKNNNNFVIFTHSYPDGDAIGSSIAFYKLLLNLGKKADMVIDSEMPYQYDFLPILIKSLKIYPDCQLKTNMLHYFWIVQILKGLK
ncbi:MAG: DHH family phosphoesterase [Candidatus Humimicrobiaceae bacterium]